MSNNVEIYYRWNAVCHESGTYGVDRSKSRWGQTRNGGTPALTLTPGSNTINNPVTIAGGTITGNVEIVYNATADLNLPATLNINGNLTVTAPNATVNNSATVSGDIYINNVKVGTWNELVSENTLIFNAAGKTLNIGENVTVKKLTLNAADAKVTVANTATFANPIEIKNNITIISANSIEAKVTNGITVKVKANEDAEEKSFTATEDNESITLNPEIPEVVPTVKKVEVTNAPKEAVEIGYELTVEATVTMDPIGAKPEEFTVETSDEEVVSVEGKKIKAMKAGTATITVKAGDKETNFEVTVKEVAPETQTLEIEGLLAKDVRYLVYGLNEEGKDVQKVVTLDEVKNHIEETYKVTFNSSAIVVEDGKNFN